MSHPRFTSSVVAFGFCLYAFSVWNKTKLENKREESQIRAVNTVKNTLNSFISSFNPLVVAAFLRRIHQIKITEMINAPDWSIAKDFLF